MTSLICAVGDVFIDRDDPGTAFPEGSITPGTGPAGNGVPSAGTLLFGNCEGVYSDAWERAPSCGSPVVAPAANAAPLARAGFGVMSLANNHSVDGGHAALLRCRDALHGLGITSCGAGESIDAARAPAYRDLGGLRIAFLAYSAVFPHGYEAKKAVPGLAPLRAHTFYRPWEVNEWNPGLAPRVTTEPFPADLAGFLDHLRAARAKADIVVVSVHWGDFTRPFAITDHERRVGHLAIDAGADMVFGHHHHMLRGVEVRDGKPIFYGLGHYGFDLPNLSARLAKDGYLGPASEDERRELASRFGEFAIRERDGYPLLPFHEDSRLTGMAVVEVGSRGVASVGFRPAVIPPDNVPRHVPPASPEGKQVIEYLRRCMAEAGLNGRLAEAEAASGLPDDCVQVLAAQAPDQG